MMRWIFSFIVSSHYIDGIFSIYSCSSLTTKLSICLYLATVFKKNPNAIDFILHPDKSISICFKSLDRSYKDNPNLFRAESWIVFFDKSIVSLSSYLLQFSIRLVRPLKLKKSAFWSEIEILASFSTLFFLTPSNIISNPFSVS